MIHIFFKRVFICMIVAHNFKSFLDNQITT